MVVDAIALGKNKYPGPSTYIIKSRFDHTSQGLDESCIVEANNSYDLLEALRRIEQQTGLACIADQYIEDPEYSVSMLESSKGRGRSSEPLKSYSPRVKAQSSIMEPYGKAS